MQDRNANDTRQRPPRIEYANVFGGWVITDPYTGEYMDYSTTFRGAVKLAAEIGYNCWSATYIGTKWL